ncbi:MAG: flagellar basal body-associated FliL family protein [Deltaproteobacteria bacterium]|nr:flagellar basal body-associated FliL family protein [Deltaproteobacteria bacterium]
MAADAKVDADMDDDEKAAGATSGGTSKLVVIALVMNMILSGAAVALGVTSKLGGEPKPAKADKATPEGAVQPSGHDEAGAGGEHQAPAEHGAEPAPASDKAASAGEHGAPPAGEHGAPPAGEHGAPGAAGTAKPANGRGPMVRLENIVVHLRNPEVDRFARLTVEYELASPTELAQFEGSAPHLRDGVITYVSDRTFEQLAGAAGITMLKRDLLEQATAIGHAKVRAVYITDFVIQ